MAGGASFTEHRVFSDLWSLELAPSPRWRLLGHPPTLPGYRWGAAAVVDPARDRLWIAGGRTGLTVPGADFDIDLLSLDLAEPFGIRSFSPDPVEGIGSYLAGMAMVPTRGLLVWAGGVTGSVEASNRYAVTSVGEEPPRVVSAGFAQPGRFGSVVLYDPLGDRVLVVGGRASTTVAGLVSMQQLLTISLSSEGNRVGELLVECAELDDCPAARVFASGVLDESRSRFIVAGGLGSDGVPVNDVWALNLAASPPRWERLMHHQLGLGAQGGLLGLDGVDGRLVLVTDSTDSALSAYSMPLVCDGT